MSVTTYKGCDVAQAVGTGFLPRRPGVLDQGSPCEIYGGQSGKLVQFLSEFFGFPLSISFHLCSTFTHVSSGAGQWAR
jgi:hypothetical protein